VAQEVVAGKDVVDLEAQGAGVALAHVALQQGLVVNGGTPLAISEQGGSGGAAARLTGVERLHKVLAVEAPGNVKGSLAPHLETLEEEAIIVGTP
jgi:hypothetical protein